MIKDLVVKAVAKRKPNIYTAKNHSLYMNKHITACK